MYRRKKQHSPFWTYCALATLVGAFVTFHFYYLHKRQVYDLAHPHGGALRGSEQVTARERWISTDAQAFVRPFGLLLAFSSTIKTHLFICSI